MKYSAFLGKMKNIKKKGYVFTHRVGDTGVGKTLEDLLGIKENNIAGPDFATYELKTARKGSTSMLTLFSKAPQPKGANKNLREKFGYIRQIKKSKRGKSKPKRTGVRRTMALAKGKELQVSVDAVKSNSVGLKLKVKENQILIINKKSIQAYWNKDTLRQSFEKKYDKLIYVLAKSRMAEQKEQFWYNEVYLLTGFSFARFSRLVKEGKLKADLRLGHYSDGRPHDHGTAFRILPKHLPRCFSKIARKI
jgi:hypothetical protein